MSPKIKRATGDKAKVSAIVPLLMRVVTNPKASAIAASRRRIAAIQPASGSANHARHHASPRTQS